MFASLTARIAAKEKIFAFTAVLLVMFFFFSAAGARAHWIRSQLNEFVPMHKPSYREPVYPYWSGQRLVNLGYAHSLHRYPQSSYLRFPMSKRKGITRIGIFGCSYVAGKEAANGHDFPSLLQKQMHEAGIKDTEIINFGVSSFGVHQMYLMWEGLGVRYDLDHVIVLPLEIHIKRDQSFVYGPHNYAPVHARFVLRGNDVELVPLKGRNLKEAAGFYHRLFPPLEYWRYDIKAPLLLQSLMPSGQPIKNPFYYARDRESEILKIYAILLNKIARRSNKLTVIAEEDIILDLRKRISGSNVSFLRSRIRQETDAKVYRAPRDHYSALGNEWRATELFAFLTGKEHIKTRRLSVDPTKTVNAAAGPAVPLDHYPRADLRIAGHSVATLVTRKSAKESWKTRPVNFKKEKITSLIRVNSGETAFVPVPFLLTEGARIDAVLETFSGEMIMPFGRIVTASSVLGTISFDIKTRRGDAVARGVEGAVRFSGADLSQIYVETDSRIRRVRIVLNGITLLTSGRIRNGFATLYPELSGFLYLRAAEGQYAELTALKKHGQMDLVSIEDGIVKAKHPSFLDYNIEKVPLRFEAIHEKKA